MTIINQDSGYLMIDIANAFAEAGHQVTLITGRLVQRSTPLHHSVKLQRVVRYNRNSIPGRLLSWFGAFFQMLFLLWFRHQKAHLFIVSNPPMAPLLPLFCSNPYSLLIYDVYIEKPGEFLPLKKKSPLAKLWAKLHTRVFAKADRIYTLTKGMQQSLEKFSNGVKVEVVPVWADTTYLKPMPRERNIFVKQHGLQEKFVVLYSGSFSLNNGVEHLAEVASLVHNKNICFLFIGEGIHKEKLIKKIKSLNLSNFLVLPWQEPDILPYSLASANIAVVTTGKMSSKKSVPSKLFSYFSVGKPILCIADKNSDLAGLVKDENTGEVFDHNETSKMASFIETLYVDNALSESYSKNALRAAKKFSKENAKHFVAHV